MTWATFYWLGWLILGFGSVESIGLGTGHPQWTLSDTVWQLFGVSAADPRPWHWKVAHFLLAAFMVWLSGHFVFRIWR